MILKMFSILDTKAKAYMTPQFHMTADVAIRDFTERANDGQSMISRYPEDFALFEIGEFNALKGEMNPLPTPHSLGNAVSYKRSQTQLSAVQ